MLHFVEEVRDELCCAACGFEYVGVYDFSELGHRLWVFEEVEWKVPSGRDATLSEYHISA